jgi:hypothetical protein
MCDSLMEVEFLDVYVCTFVCVCVCVCCEIVFSLEKEALNAPAAILQLYREHIL